MANDLTDFTLQRVNTNGTTINVASAGSGPAVLFLHGWPHTWQIWKPVMEIMMDDHTVIAPDLRGLGASDRAQSGYDLHTLADDMAGLLDALDISTADIVGIDLGTAISWMIAMRYPTRARRLAVMEGLIGTLPGAEVFLSKGPPWWFGFHGTPGLAETVLEGNEAAYIDWFLKAGTKDRVGLDVATRDAFVNAYGSKAAMRCGFEHYRAFPENARQVADASSRRSDVPVLALAGGVVGSALAGQLRPITRHLTEGTIEGCAHLIPLERPQELADSLRSFLRPL